MDLECFPVRDISVKDSNSSSVGPKGRMETLFVLKKKFRSGRVIRNIYEYLDTRTYWLKQYRYVINNGLCKYCHSSVAYGSPKKGVKTYRLISERRRNARLRKHLGWGYAGLNYYNHTEIERLDHWSDTTANIEMWAQITQRENIYRRWETRCENARRCAYHNAYDINRAKFLGNWELDNCLAENGVRSADIPKERVQRIRMLIKI